MNLILVAVAVCAGVVFGHASPPSANESCQGQMTAFPPDPSSGCCGKTARVGNSIVGGDSNVAKIDQHPWAALIDYVLKKGNRKQLCAGTLISGKYVLTAAHCIVGRALEIGTPTNVRLGEYDINNEGPDCVPMAKGGTDCTDGAISIEIEKIIPHPKYDDSMKIYVHDIGLIRLKKAAPYTDFIRPICLPAANPDTTLPPDHSLYVVSWFKDNIKKLYEVPFVNQEKCKSTYSSPGRNIVLGQGHICAGGLEGKDSCKQDGGGPLVYENKGLAELTGTVSFGVISCGQNAIPLIYTNVYEYLDWIKTVIVA